MKAFRMNRYIIAADTVEDAIQCFIENVAEPLPSNIEDIDWSTEVCCEDGLTATVRDLINRTMDERNAWLRMGVPCELHWPFIAAKLP
jgi:hypothetical protein